MEWKPQVENIYKDLLKNYPVLKECKEDILESYLLIRDCYNQKGKLLICGNGGSAADSEHIVGELLKGFLQQRRVNERFLNRLVNLFPKDGLELGKKIQEALPAISLTGQSAFSTAFSNDVSPDTVFAQQVYALGLEQDILFAISTTGNSLNVLNAVKISRALGMKSIGLTGQVGGAMKKLCDVAICVPGTQTFRIQELHLPVYHAICAMLEAEFFPNPER